MLSVGYSACHWCHVMAHESFEHEATAALLNEAFISIKVDREERPDIDAIYQKVVAMMGQGGGWPLTVFMTPDGKPFYGGTYFPRPRFVQLVQTLRQLWEGDREKIDKNVEAFMSGYEEIASMVERNAEELGDVPPLHDAAVLRVAGEGLLHHFDDEWGGLGGAPKFPNPTVLEILLRLARDGHDEAKAAVKLQLDKMYMGGIYDHLRGGFARYAVDRVWLVPHFEKMLYDNAQLLGLYADATALWPDAPHLQRVVDETVEYLEVDMRADDGTFYAATDADSEGEEGKYFCWTPDEVAEVVGDAALAKAFCERYGVTDRGNFEHGWSILNLDALPDDLEPLRPAKERLLAHRYTRVPPLRDEKVLTAWNALLVSGLCRAGRGELAVAAATRLWDAHRDADGNVLRSAFEGKVHTRGYLDDVAFFARACLDLHELTLDPVWRERAQTLVALTQAKYRREDGDGFHLTASDAEALIERTESQHDGPIPSGVGVMLEVLLRLDPADKTAHAIMHRFRAAGAQPMAHASLLTAATFAAEQARHVTIRGSTDDPDTQSLATELRTLRRTHPHAIAFHVEPADAFSGIVCTGQGTCSAPLSTVGDVLERARGSVVGPRP